MLKSKLNLIAVCAVLFLSQCKTAGEKRNVITADYEIQGNEKFTRILDKETGALIYIHEMGVSCLQIQKPTVAIEGLSDRNFPEIGHKFTRLVDREKAVVLYGYCATMDYRTCDSAAIKYGPIHR